MASIDLQELIADVLMKVRHGVRITQTKGVQALDPGKVEFHIQVDHTGFANCEEDEAVGSIKFTVPFKSDVAAK